MKLVKRDVPTKFVVTGRKSVRCLRTLFRPAMAWGWTIARRRWRRGISCGCSSRAARFASVTITGNLGSCSPMSAARWGSPTRLSRLKRSMKDEKAKLNLDRPRRTSAGASGSGRPRRLRWGR